MLSGGGEDQVGVQRPSLARNSLARFMADGSRLVFGIATSVLAARALGPAGKGTLSTLLLISHALLIYACSMGFGDALVVLIGKKRTDPHRAFSRSLIPVGAACLLGILILAAAIPVAQWEKIVPAVVIAGAGMVCYVYLEVNLALLNAREEVVVTSLILGVSFATIALATVGLVTVFNFGITGGVLASSLGGLVALVLSLVALRRRGLTTRPRWSSRFTREALRLGLPLQLSLLLIALSQRIDQVLVYSLSGEVDGGHYSIALTLGQLVVYLPAALSAASFPRLAHSSDADTLDLTQSVARMSLAGSLVGAALLLVVIPLSTTWIFGRAFAPAVRPAVVLLFGGVLWGHLWVLARAAAANGRPAAVFASFGFTVSTMLALDLLLIPTYGLSGAASASAVATTGGLVGVHLWYRKVHGSLWSFGRTLPRAKEFRDLLVFATGLVRGREK